VPPFTAGVAARGLATALNAWAVVDRHPRHAVLFALVAGLLAGPVSPAAVVGAAAIALVATSPPRIVAGRGPDERAAAPPGAEGGASLAAAPVPISTGRPAVALVAVAAVLGGALAAEARVTALDGGRLAALESRRISARAVLLEPVRERPAGPAVARARLLSGPAAGDLAVVRVRPALHPGRWPRVGAVVAVAGKVEPLGRYDAYQRRRGATAALEADRLVATGTHRGGVAGALDRIRERAERGLETGLPPPDAALLRGMILGQDERLSEAVRTDFERSGLAHILAVSGQNVVLLATLVLAAGALLGAGLRARLVAALILIAVYVPLAGGGPSIQRAGIMGGAGLVAALAGRPASRWYALGLAGAGTLLLNPLAAGEPGWQLSFAAVIGLLALAPGLRSALRRAGAPGPVAEVAAVTFAATLVTAPLLALHFERVSLASLPANLVAAAAIAPVMWLGMLAAAVAQLDPAWATPLNALNHGLLAYVRWVAHAAAALPLASVSARIPGPAGLVLVYAAAAAAILAARGWWRRRRAWLADAPWLEGLAGRSGPPGRRLLAAAVLACAAIVALGVVLSRQGTRVPASGELVVSFLSVGQGDATLLQTHRASVLVDTGPPGGPILRRLAEAGVERLDALIITHAQADHEGAALPVLRAYAPRLVVNGGAGWPTDVQRGLPAALAASRSRRLDAHAGQVLSLDGIRIRLLWPPPPEAGWRPEGDPNDRAVVAHVESGAFDLLLPADAESDVTGPLGLPQVEALKVAHHGSADEGLPDLLEQIRPRFAAIEVGRDNSYGHPTPSTLAALRTVPEVFRTDRDGTVRLRVRDGAMRVERSGFAR
jgi:competence protein ComEC